MRGGGSVIFGVVFAVAVAALVHCGNAAPPTPPPSSLGGAAGQGGRAGRSDAGGVVSATGGGSASGQGGALAGSGGAKAGGNGGMVASKPGTVVGGDCPVASPLNPNVDSSWVQYSGFGCDHALAMPGPSTPPLPPFEWGPCPASAGTTGECQQLLGRPGGMVAAGQFSFARSPTGGAILGVLRYTPEQYGELAIGEADGPIRLAAVGVGHVFSTNLAWFDATSYAFSTRMIGDDSSEHGVIAGRFGQPAPTYVRRLPNAGQISSNWAVSGDLVVRSLQGRSVRPPKARSYPDSRWH